MDKQTHPSPLDERSRDILDAIVALNVETGRPVSSGLVERSVRRRLSSATIRNVMKKLERAGYLTQLHTSSGRVPTDLGFRDFVDRLRSGWGLRRHEAPADMRRLVSRGLARERVSGDVSDLAGLLSRLTANVSIVVGPSWDAVSVARVEVYRRAAGRALLVLILENARVHTGLVELAEDWPATVIRAAAREVDKRARALTVAEIQGGGLETPDLVRTPTSRCAADLAGACRGVLDNLADGDLELEGVANVLEEPEFHEPEPLKALLRFVQSPRVIRSALARLERQRDQDFGVWIGGENPVGALRPFAVVTRGFAQDGRRGMLAVLGPRRMSYQRAFHGIDLLGRALENNTGVGTD